jgi:hypothetical protein
MEREVSRGLMSMIFLFGYVYSILKQSTKLWKNKIKNRKNKCLPARGLPLRDLILVGAVSSNITGPPYLL